ncbi:basic amino acid ABC transporter substrate-binding protein [Sporomusa termitida]|uniref:Glutamine-binding periplasmic protein n=1 Tax=Sporomusa termitida TaxID=2377 RepID=A0A517DQI8_9FIRM|nr:basic amino acid ABC transporter substrate-binding protein [Sporomusa termitida]QDR79536.1 Glutamine-binding periplasmic protein [Sporomusa termitida]
MSKKWLTLLAAILFSLSVILSGCGAKQTSTANLLRVGSDTTYAPFGFQDEKSREYVGFDIDLIKAIGKQLGYEVEIQSMNFDGLIPALEGGTIDVAISDMTITAERSQKVNFSQPYYTAGLSIVAKADNKTITGFKDLEGKRLGVSIGSTGAEEAHKIKDATISEFNSITDAFLELKNGGVDAVINDAPVNEYYVINKGNKDAKIVGEPINSEDLGIATSKKNPELTAKIDNALSELKKNGEYEKIYLKWFGKKPPQ